MAFAPVDADVPNQTRQPAVDYLYGRLFGLDQTTPGIRWWDSYPNGVEQFARTGTDINPSLSGLHGPWTLSYRSQFIVIVEAATNGARLLYLDRSNFNLVGSFGASDAGFTNSAGHIEIPNCIVSIAPAASGGTDVIVCNALNASSRVINLVSVFGLNNFSLPLIVGNQCVLGAKPDGSGTEAWAVDYLKLGGATSINLYKIIRTGMTTVANILATAIDVTWTKVDKVYGVTVDQTDGNLIVGVNTSDVVTHRNYLLKLSSATGAVMWKIDVGSINYDLQDSMKQNLITRGILYYLDFNKTLWTINTIAGTATTAALDDAELDTLHPGSQMSEDVTGSLTWFGKWTEGTSHPAYLGNYCLVQGIHSGTQLLWRYFPAGAPAPAPTYALPAQSRRRAWTFTLDGHLFYVLDLGGEGTFLYDKTSGNWCKWITSNWLGWDVTNGVMWQRDRIVGGDYLGSEIWEMQPAATQDCDSTLDITHIVTGGLLTRSRTYSSVESFNLACSVGQLDTNGATVLLSFSDDQGKTWFDCDTQTLATGDYSAEIAWRSLGSFNSPGRVFKITDVGGFIRIDGADASIDNFDDDGQQAG